MVGVGVLVCAERREACTDAVASTRCVTSKGIKIVLDARTGCERREDALSGSHWWGIVSSLAMRSLSGFLWRGWNLWPRF